MAEVEGIENLLAARQLLKTSLEKSRDIASSLTNAGPRLTDKAERLTTLEAELVPIQKCYSVAIGDQINHAVGLAAALLNVFNTVSELQKSLMDGSCSNLSTYLPVMTQFEEALEFLSDNCRLTIEWLNGILQFFEDNGIVLDQHLVNVKSSLRILHELQAAENNARVDGGPLSSAFDKLEFEFRRLLTNYNASLPLSAILFSSQNEVLVGSSSLPESVVQELKSILARLKANDRVENCISIYFEVRSSNAGLRLQALDLDYLEMSINGLNSEQSIEDHINRWSRHLELAVKHLYEPEYKLCNDVFENIEPDARIKCFAKIASQSGFLSLLEFGRKVTQTKIDPIKLLNLLDIFMVLDNLRIDMNKLFGGKTRSEIQAATRDLVKRVVDGVCEVFWELPIQVKLQRSSSPPADGGVPSLVNFVTDYCNKLLGNHYKPMLTQVLIIHQGWKQETYQEDLLSNQIYVIIKEVALNLDAWAKGYHDISQSYYFMMNNHCHFCNLKGTKLGDMMGEGWLNAHSQYKEYYAALYLKESWGELINVLNQKGHIPFAGERATDNTRLKKKLREFNQAFEQTCKRQSNWVISDKCLRERICLVLVQRIVPVYMKNFEGLVEQDCKAAAESMEKMITSLFEPKLGKSGSSVHGPTRIISKLRNVVTNQFRVSVTAL